MRRLLCGRGLEACNIHIKPDDCPTPCGNPGAYTNVINTKNKHILGELENSAAKKYVFLFSERLLCRPSVEPVSFASQKTTSG